MSPEDYIETKRSWIHKERRACPHCGLPLEITVEVPMTHPVPRIQLKGAVKAKAVLRIDVPLRPSGGEEENP